jgi:hypothetical protein
MRAFILRKSGTWCALPFCSPGQTVIAQRRRSGLGLAFIAFDKLCRSMQGLLQLLLAHGRAEFNGVAFDHGLIATFCGYI